MNQLIFGRTWEQIQAMQQGTYKPRSITGPISKIEATDADIKMLSEIGIEEIKRQQLYGVIDRLITSQLIEVTP
jgi:hypothetical protein